MPELKHLVCFLVLSSIAVSLGAVTGLIFIDLLTNKVFLAGPLTELQASIFGLETSRYVDVEQLGVEERLKIRSLFLVLFITLSGIALALGSFLKYYQTWILQRINQHLRLAMVENAVHLSLRYHNRHAVGDSIYRVYQDSAMVTSIIQNALIEPVMTLFSISVAVIILSTFNPLLGILFLVCVVPSVLVGIYLTPILRRLSFHSRLANSELTSLIQENIAGARVIKSYASESYSVDSFCGKSQVALDRAYELRRTLSIFNLAVFFFTAFLVIGVDYLTVNWIWREEETFGFGLVAFVAYQIWNLSAFQAAREQTVGISGAAVGLSNLWSILQDMGVGLKRAFFYLDVEREVVDAPNARSLPTIQERVSFKHVSFAYEPHKQTLTDISFEAKVGTVTAIVGDSGVGKSTLMNLLLRLYDIDAGHIEVDGMDIREIRVADLRKQIAIVLQENVLFPASIEENVRYASPHATAERVSEALHVSCVDEFVDDLPDGLQTELGERGAKLSTGQRQRITIARAIVKDTPILILDEPTASLDTRTEAELLRRLGKWAHERIVFLISHRLASIRLADEVLFLEDGKIAESGSYDDLVLREQGAFKAFVSSQQEVEV